jgi:hypothetical protein
LHTQLSINTKSTTSRKFCVASITLPDTNLADPSPRVYVSFGLLVINDQSQKNVSDKFIAVVNGVENHTAQWTLRGTISIITNPAQVIFIAAVVRFQQSIERDLLAEGTYSFGKQLRYYRPYFLSWNRNNSCGAFWRRRKRQRRTFSTAPFRTGTK